MKKRIAIAKCVFGRMKAALTCIDIKKGLSKTYVWSAMLYMAKAWTLHKKM